MENLVLSVGKLYLLYLYGDFRIFLNGGRLCLKIFADTLFDKVIGDR